MPSLFEWIGNAVKGFVDATFGPVIKHYLEQRAISLAEKRVLIKRWRYMVRQIHLNTAPNLDVGREIQVHPDFASLEPHISVDTKRAIYGRNRTIVFGQAMAQPLRLLSEEINRIEKKWKLP